MALDSGHNICIIIDKISFGIVTHHFCTFLGWLYIIFCAFVIELRPMAEVSMLFRISILLNIFKKKWTEFDHFVYTLIFTRSRLGLIHVIFLQFVTELRAITLKWCQNFVSAQYPGNKWIEFHQSLYMYWCWQDLGWNCYMSFFLQICNRVMALDWYQNFISVLYL